MDREAKTKTRLDAYIVAQGLCESREKAKALIMAGQVFVNGARSDKAGLNVASDVTVEIRGKLNPYVSRGGLKLEKAIEVFSIDFVDRIVLDLGASTGGFTDCALMRGAKKVYAVDVGYGQLSWSLRQNDKVVVLEKTNARYLSPDIIKEKINIVTIDLSFISIVKILPALPLLLSEDNNIIALVKPQFEAGRNKVGKKGVVRDPKTHEEVLTTIINALNESNFYAYGLDFSPITGPEGNIEYLLWFSNNENPYSAKTKINITNTVANAFSSLTGGNS